MRYCIIWNQIQLLLRIISQIYWRLLILHQKDKKIPWQQKIYFGSQSIILFLFLGYTFFFFSINNTMFFLSTFIYVIRPLKKYFVIGNNISFHQTPKAVKKNYILIPWNIRCYFSDGWKLVHSREYMKNNSVRC